MHHLRVRSGRLQIYGINAPLLTCFLRSLKHQSRNWIAVVSGDTMDGDNTDIRKYFQTTRLGDYNVTYCKVGNGPQAVFAFPGIISAMEVDMVNVILSFTAAGQDYTFYTWDMAGYYNSRFPMRRLEDISFEMEVSMCAELLSELGHEKYHIMGYSGGGHTALLFSLTYPHFVKKILIWATFDLLIKERHEEGVDVMMNPTAIQPFAEASGMGNEFFRHVVTWFNLCFFHFNAEDRKDWEQRYNTLPGPVLIIVGGRDSRVSVKEAQSRSNSIKHSRLIVMPKAPHSIQSIYPDQFFAHVKSFLEETAFVPGSTSEK